MNDNWVIRGPSVHATMSAIRESAKLLQQTRELLKQAEAVIRFRSDIDDNKLEYSLNNQEMQLLTVFLRKNASPS